MAYQSFCTLTTTMLLCLSMFSMTPAFAGAFLFVKPIDKLHRQWQNGFIATHKGEHMITSHEQEALKQLEELRHSTDTEGAHVLADKVLTDLLWVLGHKDVVKAYNRIYKWYA